MILLIISTGCQKSSIPDNDTVIARVGSEFLTLSMIKSDVPNHIWESDSVSAIKSYRDNWVNSQILYQEAKRLNIHQAEQISRRIASSERDILAAALRETIILNSESQLEVTVNEIQQYYENNRENFVLQERYIRVRHLATKTLNESREAKAQLMRGISWETVVERFSLNKQETLRLATQFYPESVILLDNQPMREYLRVIGISEISPIRGHNGQFHFIQIVEDRPQGDHPDLDWIFEQIREWLGIEKRRRAFRAYEQNLILQAQANNEIDLFDVIVREPLVNDTENTIEP